MAQGGDWQQDLLRELADGSQDSVPLPSRPDASDAIPGAPVRTGADTESSAESPPAAPPVPRPSHDPRVVAPAPESVPTVDPRLAIALGRPQYGDSVARRTSRSLRRLSASAGQEVAELTRLAQEVQQPVTTGRIIAVTSIRGGVGKSTVSALLGRTFNHYRHDPVLALEADTALDTLPVRMGAESVRWTCSDLAQILTPAMQLTDITGYLLPVSDGGWLLPAGQGRVGAPLDMRTYRTVTLALRRYFAVTVVDCETLPGEVARTAMDTAHARVVVAPMTAEGVNGTRQVLDWLAQLPHSALATTVVALSAGSPDTTLDEKAAAAHLREPGVPVVLLPRAPSTSVAHGTSDAVTGPGAEGIARMLTPLRLSAESAAEGTPVAGPVDFPALLGIDDPAALDLTRLWAPRGERDFLRVPIGLTDRHEPVLLDLKESSQLGTGPHGLCVGATGSGKSELLRTLVLALAATHSPEDLALVLVDYKGGATFAPFAELPHVAGVITNLENQAGLVGRVHTSLAGEVKRRQQVLKDAGIVADIGHYATLRATERPDLEPLPHLFSPPPRTLSWASSVSASSRSRLSPSTDSCVLLMSAPSAAAPPAASDTPPTVSRE